MKEDTPGNPPPVNMKSVLSLGYGPISPAKAQQLVEKGIAETYEKDGVIYFRKSAYTNKQKGLLG